MTNDTIKVTVTRKQRLYDFLKEEIKLSFRLQNKLLKMSLIAVNDTISKKNRYVDVGDEVTVEFLDEENNYQPQSIPLTIVFENQDLLILNKQKGIVMHPTNHTTEGTLANAVSHYFNKLKLKRKIRFVNRLDMDTTGLLIVAKNPYAHQYLAKQFEQNLEKKYLAIVTGFLSTKSGSIHAALIKNQDTKQYEVDKDGKPSLTEYQVIKEVKNLSLVECQLVTGRSHQIRAHLKSIGHPIIGDQLYNQKTELIDRQALHAYQLKFKLPRTHNNVTFRAELPEDMAMIIEV